MPALALPVAVRTAGLVILAVVGGLIAATDDHPDANIGLGMLLTGSMLLAVAVWAAVDGARSVRRGRPDREGLLVWLLSAAGFGVAIAAAMGVWAAVAEPDPVPVGALLVSSLTYATFVAVPAAVSYGLARTVTEARARRTRPRTEL